MFAIRQVFLVSIGLFVLSPALAQTPQSQKNQTQAAKPQLLARVTQNGAIVYRDPDFDASILTYLDSGEILLLAPEKHNTAFYKIRTRRGLVGYISDVDVALNEHAKKQFMLKDSTSKHTSQSAEKADLKNSPIEKAPSQNEATPFPLRRYLGFQMGSSEYAEQSLGHYKREWLSTYGFKVVGEDIMVEGSMPTEINIIFHLGAPDYYRDLAGETPLSGTIIFMNSLFVIPYDFDRDSMKFYGFGPMLKYSQYTVRASERTYDLTDLNLGLDFNFGYAKKIGGAALRFELRYTWEKTQYLHWGLAVMKEL